MFKFDYTHAAHNATLLQLHIEEAGRKLRLLKSGAARLPQNDLLWNAHHVKQGVNWCNGMVDRGETALLSIALVVLEKLYLGSQTPDLFPAVFSQTESYPSLAISP